MSPSRRARVARPLKPWDQAFVHTDAAGGKEGQATTATHALTHGSSGAGTDGSGVSSAAASGHSAGSWEAALSQQQAPPLADGAQAQLGAGMELEVHGGDGARDDTYGDEATRQVRCWPLQWHRRPVRLKAALGLRLAVRESYPTSAQGATAATLAVRSAAIASTWSKPCGVVGWWR